MLLRLAGEYRRAMDLSLVLDAEGIRHELRSVSPEVHELPAASEEQQRTSSGERWALFIEDVDAPRAEAALAAFERENPPQPRQPREAAPAISAGAPAGILFAYALIAFQLWTGEESDASEWFARGSAVAEKIVGGELFRTVTALTLHADLSHAAGNAALGGLLVALLARRLGAGAAAWLTLLSGVLGTACTAVLLRHSFTSIGASTAVFGALGTLAALQAADPEARRRAWIPLGGGLALLGFLGTDKRADLSGHLFGFAAGVLLGFATARLPRLRSRAAQLALALAACAVPLLAWLRAFGHLTK